jgi:hypothetical protein
VVDARVVVPSTAKLFATLALFIDVVARVDVPVDAKKPVVVAFVVVLLNTFSESTFMTEAQRLERTFNHPTVDDDTDVVANDDVPPEIILFRLATFVIVALVSVAKPWEILVVAKVVVAAFRVRVATMSCPIIPGAAIDPTFIAPTVRVAIVAVARFVVPVAVKLLATSEPVVVAFVPVALVKNKFVKNPVKDVSIFEKKFVVVAAVPVARAKSKLSPCMKMSL